MSVSAASLKNIPVAFASCSIGCKDEHTLPKRLDAIAKAGFTAIELSMPDLVKFAKLHLRKEVTPYDFDDLYTASKVVKAQCDAKGLKILILQPFSNFEGWAEGSKEREDAWTRVHGWIKIMQGAGTDMLQVGSSDTPAEKIGTDRSRFVKDLQELCDLLAKHNFRLAYENWCWSTHAPDWADVWDIVQKVDRPNIGLNLDTFQTGGKEWADPTTASGLVDKPDQQREKDFAESLDKLSKTVPGDKIYFLQISDAYKMKEPLSKDVDESGTRPRGRWSHDYRPLPYQGYLPVAQFTKAVLKTGFRGWFSYEVFDSGPDGKGRDYELDDFAQEAFKTQERLLADCADS